MDGFRDTNMEIFLKFVLVYVFSTYSSANGLPEMDKIHPMTNANDTGILLRLEGPLPNGLVILFMDEISPPMQFNYTVECYNKHDRFILKSSPDDASLMTYNSYDVIIDCSNASEVNPEISVEPSETTGNTKYSSDNTQGVEETLLLVKGTQTFIFDAAMLGRTFMNFELFNNSETGSKYKNDSLIKITKLPVIIHRKMRAIDHIFRVIIYTFMVFVTLAFGCKLDLTVVKASLKNPIAPCIGMGCQFIVMPLLGYGIAKIVTSDQPDVALGIFVAACCPGGGASNIYSFLLGGDLSLSITMTALSTILALGMMPLWIYTLGQQFTQNTVTVPFLNIFTTLLILILPLFVGIFIKYKLPKVQKVLMKLITPVTVICVIFLISVGIYTNLYIFKLFRPRIVLAGCLLPYFGYFIGGLIAFLVRLPWERVKTVAIETGMQNIGIAMILMMYAFPPPDGFIAAVAPVASGVMTPLPLFLITIPYLIYRRCNKDKYESVPVENGKELQVKRLPFEQTLEVKNGNANTV